jgi:hypothetical protein
MVHPLLCPTLLCPHINSTTHWFLFCILFPCHFVFVFFIEIVCLFVFHPHIVSSCDLSSHCLILWFIVKQQFVISFIPHLGSFCVLFFCHVFVLFVEIVCVCVCVRVFFCLAFSSSFGSTSYYFIPW